MAIEVVGGMMKLVDSGERVVPEWIDSDDVMGNMLLSQHLARYEDAAEFSVGKSVLDLGSGAGYGAAILIDAGARSFRGIDIDNAAVRYARSRYSRANVSFEVGDVTDLHLGRKFDVIICFEVLEHVRDPDALFRVFREHLEADGMLFLSGCVYNTRDYYRYHLRDYTLETFRKAISDGGFLVQREFHQSGNVSANDVRATILRHWRSFPLERFLSSPLSVVRSLVSTQLIHGVHHREVMFVCRR